MLNIEGLLLRKGSQSYRVGQIGEYGTPLFIGFSWD